MKLKTKLIDTFQIVGFTISTAVSIVLIFAGHIDPAISTILGLILAVFTQLFDLQLRLTNSEEKLLQSNTFPEEIYHDQWLLNQIKKMVADYYKVKESWYEGFDLHAKDTLVKCSDVLHLLSEGHMIHYTSGAQSPYSFGNHGIKQSEKSLKAITAGNVEYWESLSAQKYLQEHLLAIKRGVKVIRIFLNHSETLPNMEKIMRQQQEMGIDVYVAFTGETPKELHENFIIMDDRLVNQAEYTADGRVKQWNMTINEFEVEQFCRKFNILLARAKTLDSYLKNHLL